MTESKPRILLVDDDEQVLNMLKLFLTMLDAHVSAFSNPELALDYFSSHFEDVDCFLCDLVMSPKTGLEVLELSRQVSPNTVFYLMSANATSEDLERAKDLFVTGFIEKPMVHLQLEHLVESLHGRPQRTMAQET
jgi:two-component system response regulator GlrR